jgi:hypothetical protein
MGQRAQFLNLSHLAHDILCIPGESFLHLHFFSSQNIFMPGSAVAVEQVFSGGQDTISSTVQAPMLILSRF